jgi:tetratricopeptide (TPR) repeat protein
LDVANADQQAIPDKDGSGSRQEAHKVHKFLRTLTGIATAAILTVVAVTATSHLAFAQAQGGQAAAQPQKKVKDQGEYDVFNAVTKEADGKKKIALLEKWKKDYPDSDYKEDRLLIMIQTYLQLGQAQEILNTAKELLAINPKNVNALYWVCNLVPGLSKEDPESLDLADKAANGLINAEKPADTKPEDWAKAKKDLEVIGHKALGWVNWKRKNLDAAEKEFVQTLKLNENQAEVSSWLGAVIFQMKKPERQSEVLYNFARASVLAPNQGGMPEAQRKVTEQYLERAFNSYHGQDPAGLTALKEEAKKSAFVPSGFKIESQTEIAVRKENEFREKNPQLALWMGIKKELAGPNGEQYFESNVKNAAVPKLKGTVVAAKPPVRSKELVVGLENAEVGEVTLKFDAPLTGKPKLGSVVEFEGVPTAFAKDPFMLTFETEKGKVTGLEMEAAPAPAKPAVRPGVKKAAPKKK